MTEPIFEPWPKIPRLRRTLIISEKIDGTNAQVHITADGQVLAGSRTRYVTPGNDNYGFAQWVYSNAEKLASLLGPGRHYGEWWGAGIQRGYGLRERRFSLFNTSRWKPESGLQLHECGVYVVPTLAISESSSEVDRCLELLRVDGSVAAPGYKMPEGIVVHHTAAGQNFKVLLENDTLPKGLVPRTEKIIRESRGYDPVWERYAPKGASAPHGEDYTGKPWL